MTKDSKTDQTNSDALDAAFAQMRATDVVPRDALLDRIMQDADAVLADRAPVTVAHPARPWARMLDLIGGWPSFGGLAAATVAGLWIGVAQPAALTDLSAGLIGGTVDVTLLDSDIFAALEG